MSDQDAFTTPTPAPVAPQPTPTPSADPFADQLSMITNADGNPKYDTVDKALVALNNSQLHIANLEKEAADRAARIAALEEAQTKMSSVEDVVARLAATTNQDPSAPAVPQPVAGLDEQAVTTLINTVMTQNEQETVLKSNLNKVNTSLNNSFGDKVQEVVAAKAVTLGTTPQALKDLAQKQPEMVLALFNPTPVLGVSPTKNSYSMSTAPTPQPELEKPERSMLAGATSKMQAEYLAKVRDSVYAKHGIEE